jgi:antitoxin VapB
MALKITNPEAETLARALAEATGESLTDAVVNALRERLQREAARRCTGSLRDDLRRIQRRYHDGPVLDGRTADEIIGYGEHGLPS